LADKEEENSVIISKDPPANYNKNASSTDTGKKNDLWSYNHSLKKNFFPPYLELKIQEMDIMKKLLSEKSLHLLEKNKKKKKTSRDLNQIISIKDQISSIKDEISSIKDEISSIKDKEIEDLQKKLLVQQISIGTFCAIDLFYHEFLIL
jgi:exonuclease VII large subunit